MKDSGVYPTITLHKAVIFPSTIVPLILEGEEAVETISSATKGDQLVVLTIARNGDTSDIGVIARVVQYWNLTPQVMGATLEGLRRVKIIGTQQAGKINQAEVLELATRLDEDDTTTEAFARSVFHQFNKLMKIQGSLSADGAKLLSDENISPDKLSDIVTAALNIDFLEKIKLLETLDVKERLEMLNKRIAKELNIAETEEAIQKKITEEVSKTQREFMLRERMKAIEKELGIFGEQEEYAHLEERIKQAGMPKEAEDRVLKELNRLRRMPPGSAEAPYIWTYLELVADLPWSRVDESKINLKDARRVLDEDHYGLEKVKQRILEYLAIQQLTGGETRGTILCFIGPPGTGKTSVGQSIARATGRKFARVSLGGIRDESEIRGHRRTYVGAMPGRVIQGIRQAGTKNPVFMLDEIDKIGADYRGDPSAALLEVLDPAQNHSFSDHYLEMPFDLSKVFFITTANIIDTIPAPLRDRLEIIEFTGYTNEEKLHIAEQHLVPGVIKNSGLSNNDIQITDSALKKIITRYTREAGVRELERKIAQVARNVAIRTIEQDGRIAKPYVVKGDSLAEVLGPEQFEAPVREANDEVGVATGLAWTPVGGEIIFVEVSVVPGRHTLVLTGQLGDVMQESARAALTYIRSQGDNLDFDPRFYLSSDVHVHVPEGSIPKDGSSAGVAIAVALASALTRRKVRKEVAFTGEVTLRGKVLPVGGIKEKIVAAYRAGVDIIGLPSKNKKDLVDVPREVRDALDFHLIDHVDEAFDLAFRSLPTRK